MSLLGRLVKVKVSVNSCDDLNLTSIVKKKTILQDSLYFEPQFQMYQNFPVVFDLSLL